MLQRIITTICFTLFWLPPTSIAQNLPPVASHSALAAKDAPAQDFSRSVVPLTAVRVRGPFVHAEFGTGFCLDRGCYFIGTNYHVAAMMKHLRIKGAKVVGRFLATGPNDDGATLNPMASGGRPLRYNRSRDLAIFQLTKPLRDHHGLEFSTVPLKLGQQVDIYSYPKGVVSPFRSLQEFHGNFRGETADGLLVVDYAPNGDKRLRPGASGGIVVDTQNGKVAGVFCGLPEDDEPVAFAVPVESLAEFLNQRLPFLAEVLFPIKAEASTDEQDFYPRYQPDPSKELQRRSDQPESAAVADLRERAQSLADKMRDFIAVQTYAWGTGANHIEASDAYEVQVRSGSQQFRAYPDGKKWRLAPDIPPGPAGGVTPSDDWSTLPLYIGTKVGVQLRETTPAVVNGRRVRVFQYVGSAEDEPCQTRDIYDFLLFSVHKDLDSIPFGEVWTDQNENILRMSLHCENRSWGWGDSETIVTYGWLAKPGIEPRLVPVGIVYEAPYKKRLYWCRGQFVNYREFSTQARILSVVGVQ